MIKAIDELLCISYGLCEDVCPTYVPRRKDGKVEIAYPGDCCNCMERLFICPTEAILLAPGAPDKFNASLRWNQIKRTLSEPEVEPTRKKK